jgi:2-haloacid dehalogenase
MKYQWLLFDADGTLFDYDRAEAAALQKVFESFGFEYNLAYAQAYHRINAQIWREFERGEISQVDLRTKRFALLFEALEIEFDSDNFSRSYLKYLGEGYYLLDGAQDILEALYGKTGLMLITNGLKDVQRSRLARSTISHFFADVIISEEVGIAKPENGIFEVAYQKMGCPDKKNILMIGDSLSSDMRGGNQFGIDTCWFNPGGDERDANVSIQYEITHLSEILTIIGLDDAYPSNVE